MAEPVRCQLAHCPGWHDPAPHKWALKSLYNSRMGKKWKVMETVKKITKRKKTSIKI